MAPNSPSEQAKANPAAASSGFQITGRSTTSSARAGEAPSVAAACRSRSSMPASTGASIRTTSGQRDQRLGDRDQQRRVAQVERRLVEGDQEAEAEGHRRDAERQHEEPVEDAAQPALGRGCATGG